MYEIKVISSDVHIFSWFAIKEHFLKSFDFVDDHEMLITVVNLIMSCLCKAFQAT